MNPNNGTPFSRARCHKTNELYQGKTHAVANTQQNGIKI